jgi:hypothetical protein
MHGDDYRDPRPQGLRPLDGVEHGGAVMAERERNEQRVRKRL